MSIQGTLLHYARPFGIDVFCSGKKFLILNMVGRNLKVKYRRSLLGVFWTLLGPLASAAVYYFVFKLIFQAKTENYPAFILSGILPWAFFNSTVMEGMESITGNHGLISKIPVPIQVFPFVGTLTNLVTLAISLPIILGAIALAGLSPWAAIPTYLLYSFFLFLITYGFSIVVAVAFVFLRDLRHILGIIMQIWFYGTPVLYETSMIPEKYRPIILYLNPVGMLFHGLREAVMHNQFPDMATTAVVATWAFILMSIALVVLLKTRNTLVEAI